MYKRKTKDVYVVRSDNGYGWEDVTEENTRREGLLRLKEYRENEVHCPHKLITRRVPVDS